MNAEARAFPFIAWRNGGMMRTLQLAAIGLLAPSCVGHAAETPRASTVVAPWIAATDMKAFGEAIHQSTERMHEGMAAAKPNGDPDRDFAALMILYYQGAVEMARFSGASRWSRFLENRAVWIYSAVEMSTLRRILSSRFPSTISPRTRDAIAGSKAKITGIESPVGSSKYLSAYQMALDNIIDGRSDGHGKLSAMLQIAVLVACQQGRNR